MRDTRINNDETHNREEVTQLAEWCCANNLSLNVSKTKEVVMDFRRNSGDHPTWPSTARLWRESAALNSWGCTSKRTSPGPPTLHHSPRRRNSTYTFSAVWKEQVSLHPSSPLSTREPLRACWPAASLSGTGHVVQQTARPSSGHWTPLQRSPVPLSHPSWTFSFHDAPVKLPVPHPSLPQSLPAPTIRNMVPEHQSPLRQTAQQLFTPGCEIPELKSPRPWEFFMQFEVCYTQVSGPVQTTCSNTLSSIRTRHFSHITICTYFPKRLHSICMFTCSCTTNHLTLFTNQLLLSAHVQYSFEAFVQFVYF